MLQLQTKTIDICRISKLLVKYNIKASITDSIITLDGDVSDELLTQLCVGIDINSVQNFISQEPLYVSRKTPFANSEERISRKKVETHPAITTLSHQPSECDLIYSEVKRGEVYLCDFGQPYGSEQGFKRYALVIHNDD